MNDQNLVNGPVHEAPLWQLCDLFETIDRTQGAQRHMKIESVVWKWFSLFSCGEVYQIMRLLLPEVSTVLLYVYLLVNRRTAFVFMISKKVSKCAFHTSFMFIERLTQLVLSAFGLQNTSRGQRLLDWRTAAGPGQGDLSAVVSFLVQEMVRRWFLC